jgi:SAM-dependent methyltransferase
MHLDAVDLRSFYYRTKLGRVAQAALRGALRDMWPDVRGASLGGFGFAAPVLRQFMGEAARTICVMPAQQGAFHWPVDGPNLSVLVEERNWPVQAGFFDRLIVLHGLETSEQPGGLLEEVNRVLAPGGRAIFVVPNRTGAWARRDATPFGYGRPYSLGQLERQLQEHGFEPERHTAALYAFPSHRGFWLRMARTFEATGRRFNAQRFAGAMLLETTKLAFAAPRAGIRETARNPLGVLGGLAVPGRPAAGRAGRVRAGQLGAASLDSARRRC